MVRTPTRREYLLTIGAASVAGVAGCSGGPSGTATDGESPSPTARPETGDETEMPTQTSYPSLPIAAPSYREWQPATGDLSGAIQGAHHIGRYRDKQSVLPASTYESGTGWTMFGGYVGVEYEEIDAVLNGIGMPGHVLVGTFARGDVESRLQSGPYEQHTSRNGVTYYRRDEDSLAWFVAVGDEGVIPGAVREGEAPSTFVDETMVLFETARGNRPALHEEDDLYRTYTDAIGWPLVAWVGFPREPDRSGIGAGNQVIGAAPDDVAASIRWGTGEYLADGSVVSRYWLWTREDGPVGPDEVAATYRESFVQSEITTDDQSVAVRQDGRVVDVAVVDPVDEAGGGADPVLVTLDLTRAGQTVTVEHVAGDPVPLSRVTVRADGDALDVLGSGTLSPGGSVSFDVPAGADTVRLFYSSPSGASKRVLAET